MSRGAMHVVVVGSGPAGAAMAAALRAHSAEARLTLVTAAAEDERPEPGWLEATDAPAPVSAAALCARHGVSLRAGRQAEAIDAADRMLLTTGGPVAYDALVLALGAAPLRPPIDGDAAGRAIDVARLSRRWAEQSGLSAGACIVLLGAGATGCAAAARLASDGYRAVLLDPAAQPLAELVPPMAGETVRLALQAAGVAWQGGCDIASMTRDGARTRVLLDDGSVFLADAVLLATGRVPRLALAEEAGLETEAGVGDGIGGGIRVDAEGRTTDPHISAIGGCAAYPATLGWPTPPHMTVATATASSLFGTPCAIHFPRRALRFMIGDYPVELLRPPPGIEGHWTMDDGGFDDRSFLFRVRGETLGHVLTGARCLKEIHS